MNKGQLTALNVGGAQVERVVLHDALSSGLAARYVVIEAECGSRAQIMLLAGRVIANWRFKNSDGRDRNRSSALPASGYTPKDPRQSASSASSAFYEPVHTIDNRFKGAILGPRPSLTPERHYRSDVRFLDQAILESGDMPVARAV